MLRPTGNSSVYRTEATEDRKPTETRGPGAETSRGSLTDHSARLTYVCAGSAIAQQLTVVSTGPVLVTLDCVGPGRVILGSFPRRRLSGHCRQ